MHEFLSKWSPGEFIALAGVVFGAVVAIVWLSLRRSVRLAAMAADLKQEMLRRGMSVDEINRLLSAPTSFCMPQPRLRTDEQAVGEVAAILASNDASALEIEQLLRMLQTADSATRQMVCHTLTNMSENGASPEQMVYAIRGLCKPTHAFDEQRSVMADS